jgi:poly(A) polymerase
MSIQSLFESHPQWVAVKSICKILNDAGHIAYLAGGAVRDALLGSTPIDFDLSTSASPDQVQELFPNHIAIGKQFGVIVIKHRVGADRFEFEVATFRGESQYLDGRHPNEIHFTDAREDASRRDFTINALFYDVRENLVVDFVKGASDLERKTIRTVGPARSRFDEDKLRMLRAIRFAARLNFQIEPSTWSEIKNKAKEIMVVSKERHLEEFKKMMTGPNPFRALELLFQSGLSESVYVFLNDWFQSEKRSKQLEKFLSKFRFDSDSSIQFRQILTVLLRYQRIDSARKHLEDLKVSSKFCTEVLQNLELLRDWQSCKSKRLALQRIMVCSRSGQEVLRLERELALIENRTFESYEKAQLLGPLPMSFLNGEKLMRNGIESGPLIGKLIQLAYYEQLENQFENEADALKWAMDKDYDESLDS